MPTMIDFQKRAKLVAIVDTVLSIISLIGLLFLLILTIGLSLSNVPKDNGDESSDFVRQLLANFMGSEIPDPDKNRIDPSIPKMDNETKFQLILITLWAIILVGGLVEIFGLWVALRLLKATKTATDPVQATKSAAIWRGFSIGLVSLTIVSIVCGGVRSGPDTLFLNLLHVLFRLYGIWVVSNFKKGIEERGGMAVTYNRNDMMGLAGSGGVDHYPHDHNVKGFSNMMYHPEQSFPPPPYGEVVRQA